MGVGRRAGEEIAKWNQTTAIRFQTKGRQGQRGMEEIKQINAKVS